MHCKELALFAGRAWQSKETRFVHYCYHSDSRDPIPLKENFCFVLALLRSRTAENIQEAKELLEKLLSYQVDGNFPIYLHEFPTCYDRFRAAEVLPSLIWMARGFHHVLGKELKDRLELSIREAVKQSLAMLESYQADELIALRIGCSSLAAGCYFGCDHWKELGSKLTAQAEALGIQPSWFVSEMLGHRLASLNQIDVWPRLWQHCDEMYHEKLAAYCGPHLSEKQWLAGPEPNLFNLYMKDSKPQEHLHPSYLLGALVHPFEKQEYLPQYQTGSLLGRKWEVYKTDCWAVSLLEQEMSVNQMFSPVYLIWNGGETLQSLVAQGGNVEQSRFIRKDREIELLFYLGPEADNDHPKDRVEAAFFCSRESTALSIEGKKATVFRLGEKVEIKSLLPFSIEFSLLEGSGDFTGHISMGNRPCQIFSEGEARDWKIAIRSVRRTPDCVLKAKLTING